MMRMKTHQRNSDANLSGLTVTDPVDGGLKAGITCVLPHLTLKYGGCHWTYELTSRMTAPQKYICSSVDPELDIPNDMVEILPQLPNLPSLEPGAFSAKRILDRGRAAYLDTAWAKTATEHARRDPDRLVVGMSGMVTAADILMISFNPLEDWRAGYRRAMPWPYRVLDSFDAKRWHRLLMLALAARKTQRLVTSSSRLTSALVEHGFDAQRIRTIPGGVDPHRFNPLQHSLHRSAGRLQLSVREDDFVIVFPTTSPDRKGLARLIQAMAPRWQENWILWCAGADQGEKIKRAVAQAGCSPNQVRITPATEPSQMPQVYAAADLTVVCPDADYSPLAILESMASGTPVVATETSGVSDFATHRETCLISTLDSDDLGRQIQLVSNDHRLRDQLSTRGSVSALVEHTWMRRAQTFNDLIRAVREENGHS